MCSLEDRQRVSVRTGYRFSRVEQKNDQFKVCIYTYPGKPRETRPTNDTRRPKSLASCVFPEEQDMLLPLGIHPKPPSRTSPGHTSRCSRHYSRLENVYTCGTVCLSSICSSLACSSRHVQALPVHPPPRPRSVGSMLKQHSRRMSGSGKFMDYCSPLPPNALALSSGTPDRVRSRPLKRGNAAATPQLPSP